MKMFSCAVCEICGYNTCDDRSMKDGDRAGRDLPFVGFAHSTAFTLGI
jgi:hypothetical protein